MKVQRKPDLPIYRDAHQWFKNGDHPDDGVARHSPDECEGKVVRYFRHQAIPGTEICQRCQRGMNDHGWIDSGGNGQLVCVGDWIITGPDGYTVMHPDQFAKTYEAV